VFSISGQSTLKAAAATAASQSISTKTNINNTITESGQQKNVAVSGNTVYVVWYDFTPGNGEIFFKRSTNSGSTFSSAINLSNNAGDSFLPRIAVSGNTVYVVWQDFTPGNGEIFFRKSNAGRINLSINSGNSWYPQIAVP
jgi:hypothetical protein